MTGAKDHDLRSDAELVEVCNRGSAREATRAFEILYRRHKDFVVRVALRFVPDRDSALDVLQETFSYLLSKFPPGGEGLTLTARLTSLLYPVAKNSAITLSRKSGRFPRVEGLEPDDIPAPPVASAASISSLMAELSEERREVLVLRFVDELSLREISEALDIPLGTVKSRLHLAIRQLRDSPNTRKFFTP